MINADFVEENNITDHIIIQPCQSYRIQCKQSKICLHIKGLSFFQRPFILLKAFHSVKGLLLYQWPFILSKVFHCIKDLSLCQRFFTLSKAFHSIKGLSFCHRFFILSKVFHSIKGLSFCQRSFIQSKAFHFVKGLLFCQRPFILSKNFHIMLCPQVKVKNNIVLQQITSVTIHYSRHIFYFYHSMSFYLSQLLH